MLRASAFLSELSELFFATFAVKSSFLPDKKAFDREARKGRDSRSSPRTSWL